MSGVNGDLRNANQELVGDSVSLERLVQQICGDRLMKTLVPSRIAVSPLVCSGFSVAPRSWNKNALLTTVAALSGLDRNMTADEPGRTRQQNSHALSMPETIRTALSYENTEHDR